MSQKTTIIYPIAEMGGEILLIHVDSLAYLKSDRGSEVLCVHLDLDNKTVDEPIKLEEHLKFNAWEEILNDERREEIKTMLKSAFSPEIIEKKIVTTLEQTKLSERHE